MNVLDCVLSLCGDNDTLSAGNFFMIKILKKCNSIIYLLICNDRKW